MKKILTTIIFLAGLCGLYFFIQKPFKVSDYRVIQTMEGFYNEEKNSLDAVYIGGSNVYTYWQAMLGWDEYGISVYSLAIPSMSSHTIKYMIEEARKTQPDALFIVNLNSMRTADSSKTRFHHSLDYMHFSANKLNLINTLCDLKDIQGMERLEYVFPFIQFHSGWNELTEKNMVQTYDQLRGSSKYPSFFNKIMDMTSHYHSSDETEEIDPELLAVVDDLLDYCEEENVDILFPIVPQGRSEYAALFNALGKHVSERGFPVLNMWNSVDEIGLDLSQDYYNKPHLNIHGSLKYVDYLGQYLIDHYNFTDKREDSRYKAWNEAALEYRDLMADFAMDFEMDHKDRDMSMNNAKIESLEEKEKGSITITWSEEPEADGYIIYRKLGKYTTKQKDWEKLDEVSGKDTLQYIDSRDLQKKKNYSYIVVPVRTGEDGSTVYGDYYYRGATIVTSK